MQITVTIPDELAAQVQARGLTPRRYIENLIAEQIPTHQTQGTSVSRHAQLESFFMAIAAHSDQIPILPEEALSRESFYQDHD